MIKQGCLSDKDFIKVLMGKLDLEKKYTRYMLFWTAFITLFGVVALIFEY